jgi:PAS domain S-box-containing protein
LQKESRREAIPPSVARKLAVRIGHGQEAVAVGSRSGVIEWTNSAWQRITGWAVEQRVSKPIARLLEEIGIEREMFEYIQSHYLAGRRSTVELPLDTPDGRSLWIQLEVEPYRDSTGEITDFVAVATDITDRRLAEQALERHLLRQRVDPVAEARSERDPDKSGGEIDELRGLAAQAIKTARDLVELADRPLPREMSTAEAKLLVADLRARVAPLLDRVEGGRPAQQPVHVPELVAECCRVLAPRLPEKVMIDLALSSSTPKALADGDALADVLGELLQHSARSLEQTWGTISVTAGVSEPGHALDSEVYHASFFGTLSHERPRVFIEVHDTAANVTPNELARIAGTLLPAPPSGRAFTLLRSRIRLEEMGAELHVSGAPGCGTRLLILLPLAALRSN